MQNITNSVKPVPQRYRSAFQSKGCLGKLILAIAPLIATCCLCGVCLVSFGALLPDVTPTVEALAEVAIDKTELPVVVEDKEESDVTSRPVNGIQLEPEKVQPTLEPKPSNTARATQTALASNTPAPTNPTIPTMTPRPSNTPTPPYPPGQEAVVVEVIDSDTIDVDMDGTINRVRYIGMDTPERGMPFFDESTGANAELVSGQTVILVKDVSETDQYNRLLRYVYCLDGTFVNAELVRLGFAQPATYPPDVAYQDLFVALQREARDGGLGLWGLPTNTPIPLPTNTPIPLPTFTPAPLPSYTPVPVQPTPPPPPPAQNCDLHYPTVCIAPYPPDLDCGDIPYRRFTVLQPDPHGFDGDNHGVGCESG